MKEVKKDFKYSPVELMDLSQMNETQELIYSLLQVGEENRITRKELEETIHQTDESIRVIIKSLLNFAPVIASFKRPGGYYIAGNASDIEGYQVTLLKYVDSILNVVDLLEKHRQKMVKDNEF